jgi:hypothetical protein
MRIKSQALLCAIALTLGVSHVDRASANCRWDWDCTGGQCRQVPICDSAIGIVPPRPPSIAPIPPPTIQPVPRPTVPPIGTSSCAPRYMCNGSSQCVWQTICR